MQAQAMVETVLVMPILLMLVFSILVGGLLMTQKYAVTVAAREGARVCALTQGSTNQARDVAFNMLQAYGLSPNRAGVGSCQVENAANTQYAAFRVSYRADTIVPGFVFGGTQKELVLSSTSRFLKER
ncbi:MAG: pilus assembly protein [Clostridiales bacterium]|nr:pilus assembly protein [Clostridiales bacterium]